MFPLRPFTKIPKMFPLRWTKWLLELKKKKKKKKKKKLQTTSPKPVDGFQKTKSQECFLGDPLSKLLKR